MRTTALGTRVVLDPLAVLDRSDAVTLATPGMRSANQSCRLIRAADGWIVVNLARDTDVELLPAWLGCNVEGDVWQAVAKAAARRKVAELRAGATLLGLPMAVVGEARARVPTLTRKSAGGRGNDLLVVDLSSLWAGPLCAAIFAAAGAEVVKIESLQRRDTSASSAPALDARLNGAKRRIVLDFASPDGRAILADCLRRADVVVTSARRRAFAPLGIEPERVFAGNPGLVWIAISGHGFMSDRVAFGDDAAAAGGLMRFTRSGAPRFAGDAVADPLTGLAAAAAGLEVLALGGGYLVDAAMAGVAAAA